MGSAIQFWRVVATWLLWRWEFAWHECTKPRICIFCKKFGSSNQNRNVDARDSASHSLFRCFDLVKEDFHDVSAGISPFIQPRFNCSAANRPSLLIRDSD